MRIALRVEFPEHQGKCREFLNVRELNARPKGPKVRVTIGLFPKIPWKTEQGISTGYQGTLLAEQVIFSENRDRVLQTVRRTPLAASTASMAHGQIP